MTTEQEYRFYSKLLLSLVVATIGVFLFISIYQTYYNKLRDAELYTLKKLHSIAKTLSIEIDGDIHQDLVCLFKEKDGITTNDYDENYRKIRDLLYEIQKINGLETPIYTMFYDEVCGKNESNNTCQHSHQ